MYPPLSLLRSWIASVVVGFTEKYGVVGFTVQFSKRLVDMKEPGAVLQFDRVLSNVNGCYNPATGIFAVSRTGIYSFYFR